MNINNFIKILHIVCAIIVLTILFMMAKACYAGIQGFGTMSYEDQAMTSYEFYRGYNLPVFKTSQEARAWANKVGYKEQWRRLLNRRINDLKLEIQEEYAGKWHDISQRLIVLKKFETIMTELDYNETALRIIERMKPVGSEIEISSIPCIKLKLIKISKNI